MTEDTFGFADFDDDLFIEEEEQVKDTPLPAYAAKIETEGWFQRDDLDHESTMQAAMLEQWGPKEIKSAIEHDYLYKRYQRALDRVLRYIRIVETTPECKVSNLREIVEIGVHCAARIGNHQCLESLLDRKQTTNEPGSLLLKGRFYPLCEGRQGDAFHALVEYSQLRLNDYAAWTQMAVVCQQDWPDLALLLIQYALRILAPGRNKATVAQDRIEKETQRLQAIRNALLERKADVAACLVWISPSHEDTKPDCPFALQDLAWVLQQWASQDQEGEAAGQERAVRDL